MDELVVLAVSTTINNDMAGCGRKRDVLHWVDESTPPIPIGCDVRGILRHADVSAFYNPIVVGWSLLRGVAQGQKNSVWSIIGTLPLELIRAQRAQWTCSEGSQTRLVSDFEMCFIQSAWRCVSQHNSLCVQRPVSLAIIPQILCICIASHPFDMLNIVRSNEVFYAHNYLVLCICMQIGH